GESNGLSPATSPIEGLAVTAESFEDLVGVAVGATGSANAAIAGSSVVNLLLEGTKAFIDSGALIDQNNSGADAGQDVSVLASNESVMGDVAGAFSVAATADGGASIGGGADVGVDYKDTEATIGAGAKVAAANDVL